MIQFKNLSQEEPYLLFKTKYDEAYSAGQKVIEAISISSFENKTNEVDSRFVNLKFVSENEFIFFSNYKSPKANSFKTHDQIAALIYWSSINVQIRMKAKIIKMSNGPLMPVATAIWLIEVRYSLNKNHSSLYSIFSATKIISPLCKT